MDKKTAKPVEESSLTRLPHEILMEAQKAGLEIQEKNRSATFMHMDQSTIESKVNELYEGKVELMDIKAALQKYPWLEEYRWKLVSKECQMQSAMAGVPWEMALSQNLQDLNRRYHIDSPIAKEIRRVAEEKLGILSRETLLKEVANGNNTVKSLAVKIRQPPYFVRAELKRIEKAKLIWADKNHKPFKFYINKP